MMNVVVARKIADVRARVTRVRELLPPGPAEFIARRTDAEALILNLFLALQGTSDLALHVVADRGLGVPADARGAFDLLVRAGILDGALAMQLNAAVGLRNRIAHEYGRLDLTLVFEAARDDLEDLTAFVGAIAAAYGIGGS